MSEEGGELISKIYWLQVHGPRKKEISHQSARKACHSPSTSHLPRQTDKLHSVIDERQHLNGGTHKQTGRNSIILPVPICQTDPSMGRVQFHEPSGSLHPKSSAIGSRPISCLGQVIGTEWSLHPLAVRRTFQIWWILVVGLFISVLNKQLLVYCSLLPNPMEWQEDVF